MFAWLASSESDERVSGVIDWVHAIEGGADYTNSNPSGYPPTGMMFEVTRKVKCYVGLAFRILLHNKSLADGWAGGRTGPD